MPAVSVRTALLASVVAATAVSCRPSDAASKGDDAGPADAIAGADEAESLGGQVLAISGPGGLTSSSLPAGTFLGQGGQLQAGQTIETPRGTLAEVELRAGVRVRLNESTAITLPSSAGESLKVLSGEIVVVTPKSEGEIAITVAAGDEWLAVRPGAETQIRSGTAARHYAVVTGRAELRTPSRTLELGAGESIDAPLPADVPEVQPTLSLAALDETSWSRTFEVAAKMADAVPRGIGSLTARVPGSNREEQKLQLTEESVTVNITGRIAHTEIEQAFFNDRAAVLEGIYRFPLPSDGSVSGLSLLVGNRWMEGEIVEKERGRQIFKQIVDATIPRDPALLEWEQGNIFKLRVFPIPGRGDRRIRLSYTQVLPVVGDTLRYRFPMAGSGAGGTEIGKFKFVVNVDRSELDQAQIAEIETPMLELDRKTEGDRVTLSTEVAHFVPSFDLGVDVPLAKGLDRVQTATHLDQDGQAYFMASLRPDWEMQAPTRTTHYAFVLDRSHSTTPELWTLARGIVEAMAGTMEPEDRFAVLACDTACDTMPGGLRAADAAAAGDVQLFLDGQDLAGASDLGGMIEQASETLAAFDDTSAHERVIVYLGDGAPSSGELAADKLAKLVQAPLRDARVMAVALGSRSDLTTLGAIVQTAGGDLLRADPRDDLRQLVREIQLRAQVPVARDIELDLPDGMTAVRTLDAAGLREGDSVMIVGKLRHPVDGDVVVRARGPKGRVEARFAVQLTADRSSPNVHRHLPRTWAALQIQHLTQTRGFDAQPDIIALSKDYTVMSRFTSLIVLENDAMFREFNVVRATKNTDRWTGDLPEPEPSGAPATTAELKPTEDPADNRARDKANDQAITTTPALGSASSRAAGEGDGKFDANKDIAKGKREEDFGGPFAPPPPAEPAPFSQSVEKENRRGLQPFGDELADFEDHDEGGGAAGGTVTGGATAKPSAPAKSAPTSKSSSFPGASTPQTESKAKKAPSASAGSSSLDFDDRGGWGGGRSRFRQPVRTLALQTLTSASSKALANVEGLQRVVAADPTKRAAHGKLVRAAIHAGHPKAIEHARAWAEADPDHAPALLSLADLLAADGDPMALRAYESAVEVRPFDRERHAALARAFASKGDHRRACSHQRAVVSIDPSKGSHHAELARCLVRAGRDTDARIALADGSARASTDTAAIAKANAEVASARPAPVMSLPARPQLSATLSWTGEDDLDIVVVDSKGQRLSAMRPESGLAVIENAGLEQLALSKVHKAVFIEITRTGVAVDDARRRSPISALLHVKVAGGGTKAIPIELSGGSLRVAKASWTTVWR